MGFGGWELLIIALIVILIFGTKKLRNVGKDLGGGIKSFKKALKEGDDDSPEDNTQNQNRVIDGEAKKAETTSEAQSDDKAQSEQENKHQQ